MTHSFSPVFNLPSYTVGPYTMRVVPAHKSEFCDKRRKVEHDWNSGTVLIREDLNTRKTLELLTRSLITAIHYRSGLNDTCDEEAFTHSLATGLTELARNCPEFWARYNRLLEDDYAPGAGWGRAAKGLPVKGATVPPKTVVYNGRCCEFQFHAIDHFAKSGAFGLYTINQGLVELPRTLSGANGSLVAMHETLHFLHECEGLQDSDTEKCFKDTQVYMLLRFLQQNPTYWNWWLYRTRPERDDLHLAA